MLLLVSLASLNATGLKAQETESDRTLSPYFVVISDNPDVDQLPLKSTTVKGNIVGSIADVTVRQTYVNNGKNTLEAIYTFPLSTRAAVYGMQMTIGSRIIRAKIEEKNKARADYEQAKQEGKRASLLEQSRPNVFTMNVSNIMVGDTIEVELKYTELLVPEKGVYSFVYPTVVGPRYAGKTRSDSAPGDPFVASPYTHQGTAPAYDFGYELTINSAVPLQDVTCTSHKMKEHVAGLRHITLRLDSTEVRGGNRDVIVNYSLRGNEIQSGVMLYEGEEENFFLAMVQPPKRVQADKIPPREYIFIVDVSGSMWGTPMDVTKKLMRNLISNLKPDDKFNIVLFSGNAALFNPVSVDATSANIDRGVNFIQSGHAYGGTEVLNALRTAYALPRLDDDVARTFVMATDGYVTCEDDCFELVRNNSGSTNFFIFGIGTSVNRYMIEGMAFAGGGEPMIVTKMDEAARQAERFREYISTPVLTRIKLNTKSFKAYDIEPSSVPDMMAERPILIFGKYTGKAAGSITITGKVGREQWRQTFDLSKYAADTANAALRYLWARERIKYLDYLNGMSRNHYNDTSAIARQILSLGLKYNLMTNYTSFVAIDEVVVNRDGKQVAVKQALPLPEGVSDYAVGYDAGQLSARSMGKSNRASLIGFVVHEDEVEVSSEDEIFSIVETTPEFPGGLDSLAAFLQRNIKYPAKAKKNKIEGTVYINFCVEKDGSISNIKIIRDIGGGCGAEAVRVVSMMPRWTPGKQSGKPVRTQFTLPVRFKL